MIYFRIVLLVFVSAFRGVVSEEKTVWCDASAMYGRCTFKNFTFNQDTKLNIVWFGAPEMTDKHFTEISFTSSSISLVHPDLLAKFPNLEVIDLGSNSIELNELTNPDRIENCHRITRLYLHLNDFGGISSNTFSDCKKLETLWIETDSLELPDGLFKNQENLRNLLFRVKNLKLRVSSFEGLKSLSELSLISMDLSQMEENFFQSLNIKRLNYNAVKKRFTFPIESLNSQETIEYLTIMDTDLSQLPETFGPTLRSMKQLKRIDISGNSIGSVEAFVDLTNVEWIELSRNEIEELPANSFKGCPQLSELHLAKNPIKALRGDEFDQLGGLKVLSLWHAKLTSIAPTTFHPLQSLETLYLSESFTGKDNIIGNELFMTLTNLKRLDLSRNNIQAIHPETFKNLHHLDLLDLLGNTCFDGNIWDPTDEILKEKLKVCFENYPK